MTQNPKPSAMIAIRKEIDQLDEQLVRLLADRQRLVERVITIKAAEGLPARIPERIDEVLDRVENLANANALSPDLARTLWATMIEWFVAHEEKHLTKANPTGN